MAILLRFSEAAALGLHAMAYLAMSEEPVVSAGTLARFCGASEAHMIKVCQRLSRGGLLSTRRGLHGGFALRREPGKIRLLDVYGAIEGRVELKNCLFRTHSCRGYKGHRCLLGEKVGEFERGLLKYLKGTTLAALAAECRGREAA